MSWLKKYVLSSIGKKQLMAVTGISLAGFLLVHFIGNVTLLIPDTKVREESFLLVAQTYASLKFLLYIMEVGLLLLFAIHIFNAFYTWLENRAARKQGYLVNTKVGDRGLPSFTMIISGIYLAVFVVWHVGTFKYGLAAPVVASSEFFKIPGVEGNLYSVVMYWFTTWYCALFYVGAMLMVGSHLWHGVGSFFQTLGLNHPKYTPIVNFIGRCFALLIGLGNALLITIVFLREVV